MLPSAQEISGFIEISKTKNITKAAQRLGITQPSLSLSLRKLEETIGEPLVMRSKSGVELTIAGKEFLKYAQQLMTMWLEAKSNTQRSAQVVQGSVKLGCHPAVGLYTLDRFVPKLLKKHARLELNLIHDLSRKICQKVQEHELDLGLVINPHEHPDLILTKILSDEVRLWGVPDCPDDVLLCHPELIQTQDILKKLKRSKVKFKRQITSDSLENLAKLAIQGVGVAILPTRVVEIFDQKKKLQAKTSSAIFKDELYLVYRVENRDVAFIKEIKEMVKASL